MPSLSLNMMVRNAAAFLPRALGSTIDHIDELVITDTGSTDNTKDVIAAFWKEHGRGRRLEIIDCNSKTHPDDWLLDTAASYAGGDFQILPPFSQSLILINWQRPRQLAQDASRSDFVTYMDADDIFTEAHKFPKLMAHMEEHQYDLALTPYLYRRNEETGLVKAMHYRASTGRRAATRWISPYHETWRVEDPAKIASYDKPITVDLNDHKDPVNRVINRGTKILAHAYFTGDHSPHTMFKLAQEISDTQPDVAIGLYRKAIPGLSSIPHKAIGLVRLGSLLESQHWDQARTLYGEAYAIFPYCPEAAFGLARLALAEGLYEQSVEWSKAGREAAKHDSSNILIYNPIARHGHSRIVHAMALAKLGHHREALVVHDEGKEILPKEFAELRYFLDKAQATPP